MVYKNSKNKGLDKHYNIIHQKKVKGQKRVPRQICFKYAYRSSRIAFEERRPEIEHLQKYNTLLGIWWFNSKVLCFWRDDAGLIAGLCTSKMGLDIISNLEKLEKHCFSCWLASSSGCDHVARHPGVNIGVVNNILGHA